MHGAAAMHAPASMHATAAMAAAMVAHPPAATTASTHLRDHVVIHVSRGVCTAENLDRVGLRGAETEERERKQRVFENT
jgi:hypothetical protein